VPTPQPGIFALGTASRAYLELDALHGDEARHRTRRSGGVARGAAGFTEPVVGDDRYELR
jgi:hypothetical protein